MELARMPDDIYYLIFQYLTLGDLKRLASAVQPRLRGFIYAYMRRGLERCWPGITASSGLYLAALGEGWRFSGVSFYDNVREHVKHRYRNADFGDFMAMNDTTYAHLTEAGNDVHCYVYNSDDAVFSVIHNFITGFSGGYKAFMTTSRYDDYYELHVFPASAEPQVLFIAVILSAGPVTHTVPTHEYFRRWISPI